MLNRVGSYVRAHHVGLLACVLALSGSAYAAGKIGPRDITKNAVRAKHIKPRQVGAAHLRKTVQVSAERSFADAAPNDGNWSGTIVTAFCPKAMRAIGFRTLWTGGSGEPQVIGQLDMIGRAVSVSGSADNGGQGIAVNRLRVIADCLKRGR